MGWNYSYRECQIFIPVDCSNISTGTQEEGSGSTGDCRDSYGLSVPSRDWPALSVPVSVSTSDPSHVSHVSHVSHHCTVSELETAFCKDVASFNSQLQSSVQSEYGRPSSCAPLPLSLRESTPPTYRVPELQMLLSQPCAVVFDSHTCTGGWALNVTDGESRDFSGLFLSANWFMRWVHWSYQYLPHITKTNSGMILTQ